MLCQCTSSALGTPRWLDAVAKVLRATCLSVAFATRWQLQLTALTARCELATAAAGNCNVKLSSTAVNWQTAVAANILTEVARSEHVLRRARHCTIARSSIALM